METASAVVTREQLHQAGRGHDFGDRRVRAGEWARLAPSIYVIAVPDLLGRVQAAVAHAGVDAVVTGWAACAALGLPYVPDQRAVPVLVPAGRRRVSTPYVQVLPTTRRPTWWIWHGVRIAAPARGLVDAARALSELRAVRALTLGALAEGAVQLRELRFELQAGARGGSALCRRALQDASYGAASAPEAELADRALVCARAGRLPPFLLNPDVLVDGRFVGRPDGWLMGLGLGWEVDSRQHHGRDDQFDATLARHDGFVTHGLVLLHVTPRRLRRLGPAYAEVLVQAADRRRVAGLEPAGLEVRPRGPLLGTGGVAYLLG